MSQELPNFPAKPLALVADDNELSLKLLEEQLKVVGFEVLTALDGGAALQLYFTHRENLKFVLLDYFMPEMNGDLVASAINADKKGEFFPFVCMVTGSADPNLMFRLQSAGINLVVIKPDGLKALLQLMWYASMFDRRVVPRQTPDTQPQDKGQRVSSFTNS